METVRRTDLIWQCRSCWAIFHLACITRWSSSSSSAAVPKSEGGFFSWSCPQCRAVMIDMPTASCFCGKETDPEVLCQPNGHQPHSCGQQCGRLREGTSCPHPCTMICHPGPCPPCPAMGPPRTCFCGKKKYRLRCGEDDGGISCGEVCGKVLNCGIHHCEEVCHSGPCEACKHTVHQNCYCGKQRDVERLCGTGEDDTITGGKFSCGEICGKLLSCGKHHCTKVCHKGSCAPCSLVTTPELTCPCGKHRVIDLLKQKNLPPRESCEEPLPLCGEVCNKKRPHCSHRCKSVCHEGPCPPCEVMVDVKCRCGQTTQKVPCWRLTDDPTFTVPTCERVCRARKNCGRHVCMTKCCPSFHRPDDPSGCHTCMLVCGKKLPCGHTCEVLCHKGPCPKCSHIILEPLHCNCGKTTLLPPLPCGTQPPLCKEPCKKVRPCGHVDAFQHTCHFGDCPPCVVLVDKMCCGGHTLVHNIPCSRTNVCCGEVCGKLLPCGQHTCRKICHPGECMAAEEGEVKSCGQICGKPLPLCGHPCQMICHPGTPCGTDGPCKTMVEARCPCGQRVSRVMCGVKNDPQSVEDANKFGFGALDYQVKSLDCDDECARIKRRKALAAAFDVDPLRGAPEYGDFLIQFAVSKPSTIKTIETSFHELLSQEEDVMQLKPMDLVHRRIVHMMAKFYNIVTFSEGSFSSGRYVVLTKHKNSMTPTILLSEVALSSKPASSTHPVQPSVEDEEPLLVLRLASSEPLDKSVISRETEEFISFCDIVSLDKCNMLIVCKETGVFSAIRNALLPFGIVVD